MTTIVSAFISNVNTIYPISKYYESGKHLLQSTNPKILFVDDNMFDFIGDNYDMSNTLLIKVNRDDFSYLNEYTHLLHKFEVNTPNITKDTLEYMLIMCNKTEWIKQAIMLNPFLTDNFTWIDFGIRYVFKCSDNEFIEKINNLKNKIYPKVRMGNIWDVECLYNIDIYRNITWYFAGGIFGGSAEFLVEFSEKMKTKCIEIITRKNTIMWEVNIWYLIYRENPELFDLYKCDHNDSIVDNY